MARILSFAVFFTVMMVVVGGGHYYMWARLVRDPAVPHPWRKVATIALVMLALNMVISLAMARFVDAPWFKVFLWTGYIWMGAGFMFLVLLGVGEFTHWLGPKFSQWIAAGQSDPSRRMFLARAIGSGAAVGGMISTGVGLTGALRTPMVKPVAVPITRLPDTLKGFKIVQISDLHVGPTIRKDFVEAVVSQINSEEPDVVAITGDLVDGSVESLREHTAPLADIRAKHGVFFVTGNHEYYSGATEWTAECERLGMRVLVNERVTVGEGDAQIDIAGVPDWRSGVFDLGHKHDVDAAMAGRDTSRPVVLLAHQPKAVHDAARHKVDLVLSGHTHGGQIWPFGYLVWLTQPYMSDLNRHEDTYIYVSRGTGYWGPPMRLGNPSEVTSLVLEPA